MRSGSGPRKPEDAPPPKTEYGSGPRSSRMTEYGTDAQHSVSVFTAQTVSDKCFVFFA